MAGELLGAGTTSRCRDQGRHLEGTGQGPPPHHGPTSHLLSTMGQGQCQEEPTTH